MVFFEGCGFGVENTLGLPELTVTRNAGSAFISLEAL